MLKLVGTSMNKEIKVLCIHHVGHWFKVSIILLDLENDLILL